MGGGSTLMRERVVSTMNKNNGEGKQKPKNTIK
jgi:hypothetical protein